MWRKIRASNLSFQQQGGGGGGGGGGRERREGGRIDCVACVFVDKIRREDGIEKETMRRAPPAQGKVDACSYLFIDL